MEAIGVGASVLAFVTLGLKSVKTIDELVASVKDGKGFVEQAHQDIQGLRATLEKLRGSRAIVDRNDHRLTDKVKSCADDLKVVAEKLQALTIDGSEPALGRQWKKVKMFLKEKDLERVASTVVKHTAALSLYLQTIDSEVLFEVKEELSIARQTRSSAYRTVQDSHSILTTQEAKLTAAVNTTVVDQAQAIQEIIRKELGIMRQEQSTIASQQTVVSETVQQIVPKLTDQTETVSNVLRAALSEFAAGLDNQVATRIDCALEQLLSRLSINQTQGGNSDDIRDKTPLIDEPSPTDTITDAELENNIRSLINTLRVKQGIVLLDRASSITKAFFTFLKAAVDEAYLESSPTFMSRYETWCETCTDDDLAELRRDLMVVQSVLLSSRSVSVNEPSEKADEWGILWNRTHKRSYDMSSGTLSIISNSRYSRKRHRGLTLLSNKPDESEITQKDIRIRFHPKSCPTSTPIAAQASIRQLYNNQGTWNSIPRFSVHNILPRTSRIFQIVSAGQLAELQRMLWSREAFLGDQDEDGRSLLFYGNEQPEMCRFLLEHGADANHVAPRRNDEGRFVTAISALFNDFEIEREELEPILECRKLLLQAGCDPSWKEDPLDEYDTSPLTDMFRQGVVDAMRICFDYSGGLLTPEVVIDIRYGSTPLLSYCHGEVCNNGPTIEGFTLLLNRGADLSTRDSQGNSCLHLCLIQVQSDSSFRHCGAETAGQYLERVRLSLGYLIQHGAEVHAINNLGLSVSDIAYEDNVRGHLWDVVLADYGFDVTTVRTVKYCWRPCRVKRTRVGTTLAEMYTKDDFMSLWKGKEHLCPYYEEVVRTGFDDQLYSDPESDSGEDNDDSDECSCCYGDSGEDNDDSDEGSCCYGDSGEDNDDSDEGCYDEQSGSDDGSDDESDGGCTLEGA